MQITGDCFGVLSVSASLHMKKRFNPGSDDVIAAEEILSLPDSGLVGDPIFIVRNLPGKRYGEAASNRRGPDRAPPIESVVPITRLIGLVLGARSLNGG